MGNGHADALYEGFKLMRWGQLCWFHHLQPSPPVRRGWIVSLENVAGEESVKYRGYLCTSTTKKKEIALHFQVFDTRERRVAEQQIGSQRGDLSVCGCERGWEGGWRGGVTGGGAHLHVVGKVVFATAVHSVE